MLTSGVPLQIVELPVHPSSAQHQRRRQAEGCLCPYQDQGCRSPLLQPRLQEGRCRSRQACRRAHLYAPPSRLARPNSPRHLDLLIISCRFERLLIGMIVQLRSLSASSPSSRTPPSTRSLPVRNFRSRLRWNRRSSEQEARS